MCVSFSSAGAVNFFFFSCGYDFNSLKPSALKEMRAHLIMIVYIYIEREREREGALCVCVYIYIYGEREREHCIYTLREHYLD